MAHIHIFEINRPNNKIYLGTTGTTINIASHTASKLLSLDASKNLSSDSSLLTPTFAGLLVTDKIKFTQVDGNEYIDSLADGYLDYSATTAHRFRMSTADIDVRLEFVGTSNSGLMAWMEDEDYFKFSDDVALANAEFIIFDKASGNGIKVDTATPTFGFADLLGDQFSRNTGGTKPTLATYNGAVDAWQFSDGDEAYLSYHIPHDYVPGTDIHLHIHWSQNNAGATGGTIDFKYFAIYAKGHNQVSGSTFTSTPITATFSSININDGDSGLNQYQQHLTEVTISAASANAALFDRDDFEPDGVIELTLEMDANNLTGTPSDPFIHYVDIHYQTTGIIGTKSRTPDFYA
jgi:hypothetical protein